MTQEEQQAEAQRIVRRATERGDLIPGDDGYFVFWPTPSCSGAFNATTLRTLADELDRLNSGWDAQVKRDVA